MTGSQTITSSRLKSIYGNQHDLAYLEIGVAKGETFNSVDFAYKRGVDPNPDPSLVNRDRIFVMTSDNFFKINDETYDVCFIDGLHTFEQALRDLLNCLNCVRKNGLIILDDVYPDSRSSMTRSLVRYRIVRATELARSPFSPDVGWQGDVFRVIPLLNRINPPLQYRTVVGNGDKLQTFIFGESIGSHQINVESTFCALQNSSKNWKPRLYGRQPRALNEISDLFHPTRMESVLQEISRTPRATREI